MCYFMSEELKKAAAEQAKQTETAKPEAGVAPEATKEGTIGEALDTKPDVKEAKVVPEAALLEFKNENKQLKKEMKELRKAIEEGATKKEISTDLKAMAEKHNVDPEFLQEFATSVRASMEQEFEDKVASEVKPLKDKEKADKINTAFNTHFTKAMEKMPEFEGVVKADVIKSLSLDPKNANKTFTQLIEETYGHLIQGKRTVDSASTRANKNDSLEVDVARAQTDTKYFKEIMANPTLKKKYNESLTSRLSSQL